jgi:hypothetical protein
MKNNVEIRYLDCINHKNRIAVDYNFAEKLKKEHRYILENESHVNRNCYESVFQLLKKSFKDMLAELDKGSLVIYVYYLNYPSYKRQYNTIMGECFDIIEKL